MTGVLSQTTSGAWALQLSSPTSLKGVRVALQLGKCCASQRKLFAPGATVGVVRGRSGPGHDSSVASAADTL